MKLQVLHDNFGNQTGVYIPIEDWKNLKKNYPSIDKIEETFPQWKKEILDVRLTDLKNADNLEPIEELFKILDAE